MHESRYRGQSSVELLAVVPAVALLALAAGQIVLTAASAISARGAARVGARAALVGQSPSGVVRASLPRAGGPVAVEARDGVVRVRMGVPGVLPGISGTNLSVTAEGRR